MFWFQPITRMTTHLDILWWASRCIRGVYITAGTSSHFAALTTWVALQWEGTYSNNIGESNEGAVRWCPPPPPSLPPFPKGPASQLGLAAPDWKSVCMWGPLKRCADQTARTFSVEESARWRAAPTRHHALQAPADRLPTATHRALHPPLALCSLFWVSRFHIYVSPTHLLIALGALILGRDRNYKLYKL